MKLTQEFYEISKSLDRYHKSSNENPANKKCVHCNKQNTIFHRSILCSKCDNIFNAIHLQEYNRHYKEYSWVLAVNSSSFEEFKLKVMLNRLD